MHFIQLDSPIGRIEVESDGEAITSLTIEREGELPRDGEEQRPDAVLALAARQLGEYFDGRRTDFDLPVAVRGTAFQQDVWSRLSAIPHGTAMTYARLGRDTGREAAGRAIGGAVGANPVPIIVPCHRVLAADGRITGYSAGEGIPTKRWLLDHEGVPHR